MTDHPAWLSSLKQTLEAHASLPESRFAQLATVDDGAPANRTLVFRRFLPSPLALVFSTDARSEKGSQIARNPRGELCWWFPSTREQFRIRGTVAITDGAESGELARVRAEIWSELREGAKRSFAWPPPGKTLASEHEFEVVVPESIPPQFALLLLSPERVDHLDLRPDPHFREISTLDRSLSQWRTERVNP